MKKIIVSIMICIIPFIIIFLSINKKEKNKEENKNISIILETEEGNIESNTFPSKYEYEYNKVECENTNNNINPIFDVDRWRLDISLEEERIDGSFNCKVYFKEAGDIATKIIKEKYNSGSTDIIKLEQPETDQTPAQTEYRYSGSEVNNYILFNDELWRIIGVFSVDDGTGNYE